MNKLEWVEKTAKDFISEYIPSWNFEWNDTKSFMGCCVYSTKTIKLSKTFANHRTLPETLDTILHEIAHAIVGRGNGHNADWKAQAVKVGATPRASSSSDETVLTPEQLGAKWLCVSPKGTIIKSWQRKPNKSTFAKLPFLYEVHKKAETLGKLRIITMEEYKNEA